MSMTSRNLQGKILHLNTDSIKNLLLAHMEEDTDEAYEIFTKELVQDRVIISPRNDLTNKPVLDIVFNYAPTALMNEVIDQLVECQDAVFVNLLSQTEHYKTSFISLLTLACDDIKNKVLARFETLQEASKVQLLFGDYSFKYFRKLVKADEPMHSELMLDLINQNNITVPPKYLHSEWFIHFFKKRPSESLALALLDFLDHYDEVYIYRFLVGKALVKDYNLLHIIFSSQTEAIISRFLFILDKVTINQRKSLLMQKDIRDNKTAVEFAFDRKDHPGIGVLLVKTLQKDPVLRELFTETTPFQPLSLIHYAVTTNHVAVVRYYLEQPGAKEHYSKCNRTMKTLAQENKHFELLALVDALPLLQIIHKKGPVTEQDLRQIRSCLKENPAIVNSRWLANKTLLHYATSRNLSTIVQILIENRAPINHKDNMGNTVLDEALEANHFETIEVLTTKKIIKAESLIEAVTHSLEKIISPVHSYELLQNELQQDTTEIEQYCRQQKDSYLFFLIALARLISIKHDKRLIQACKTLILTHLEKLDCVENHLLHNAIQLQLMTFLFALPCDKRVALLNPLPDSELEKTQLGLVLLRGLRQPAFFSKFSAKEHKENYILIKQLAFNQDELKKDLTIFYFQYVNLSSLTPDLLKELTADASYDSLLFYAKRRKNPILVVLTIEKLLATGVQDEENLIFLLEQLTIALHQLVATEGLSLVLNLAESSFLKAYLSEHLENDGVLQKQLDDLFTAYRKKTILIPGSFLYEQFLSYSSNLALLINTKNHQALTEMLADCPPEVAAKIMQSLQKNLKPHLLQSSFLHQEEHLAPWLERLKNRRQRFMLALLIKKVGDSHEQMLNFTQRANEKDALSAQICAEKIKQVYSALFKVHIDKVSPAWNQKIEDSINQLGASFAKLPDNNLEILSLCEEVKSSCIKIDQDQQAFYKQLANANNLPFLTPKSKAILNQLHQAVLDGVLQNPKRNELLVQLFNWSFDFGPHITNESLFSEMQHLIETTDPEQWEAIEQRINNLLAGKKEIASLLFDLQLLSTGSTTSIEDLMLGLYESNEIILNQAITLCAHAKIYDFKYLLNYIATAKALEIPFDLIKIQVSELSEAAINPWIHGCLEALESYASQALFFKILKEGAYQKNNIKEGLGTLNRIIAENDLLPHPNAINFLITTYYPLLKNSGTVESRAFILLLSNLFKQAKITIVNDIVLSMPNETISLFLDHCLLGLHSVDKAYEQACHYLLSNLCQANFNRNSESLELIKSRLGEQDLEFLDDENLQAIAKNILAQSSNSLLGHTINGIWLQRLICSPEFIASCKTEGPEVLKRLTTRYRFISLTLKQDEFDRYNNWLKGKLAFYDQHKKGMTNLRKIMMKEPEHRVRILAKLERLLQFRADDSIRALLMQLEDNSRQKSLEVAEKSLGALYSFYNNSLTSLRSDLLFKVTNFLVSSAARKQGDITEAQNTLLIWLKRYLPYQDFVQKELVRKQNTIVFNEQGEKIGFINESNHVMTLVDDVPWLLLDIPGNLPEMSFYDKTGSIIGSLTQNGEFKHENIFQKDTSALLIANVPRKKLEQSPAALDLLINDTFTENSIATLYEKSGPDKYQWITKNIDRHLAKCKKLIHKDNLKVIVQRQPFSSIFSLLAKMKLQSNALQLFEIILTNKDRRHELFSGEQKGAIFKFFKHHNTPLIFANFLINHSHEIWFTEGLKLFADYAKKSNQANLLTDALLIHEGMFKEKSLSSESYDLILITLIGSEASAKLIWDHFLNAAKISKIDKVDAELADEYTSFYHKRHCVPCIATLSEQKNWSLYQYRLILLIIARQQEQLFESNEIRFSEKLAWSRIELEQMSIFTRRHFHQPENPDRDLTIGKSLLGELVFRCANFGLTSLFYKNNVFDNLVATQLIDRGLINNIAAKNYLFITIKSKVKSACSTLINWFNGSEEEIDEEKKELIETLKSQQAIIDWNELATQTWEMNDSQNKLPIINAFLINYSGPKEPLIKLVNDYIKKVDASHLRDISEVMMKFPHRDFSACIFAGLEDFLTTNPNVLNKNMLKDMSKFYLKRYFDKSLTSPAAEIKLITHFGKQKKYDLVIQCCDLLAKVKKNPGQKKLLRKIRTEARVEAQLLKHQGKWYFSPYKFCTRLWNYGLKPKRNASKAICFHDQKSTYISPTNALGQIETPVPGGQLIERQLKVAKQNRILRQHHQQYIQQQTSLNKESKCQGEIIDIASRKGLYGHSNSLIKHSENDKIAVDNKQCVILEAVLSPNL